MTRLWAGLAIVFLSARAVWAQDLSLTGMADLRLIAPSGQVSQIDGGLGKLRWGDGRGSPFIPGLAQAVLRGTWGVTPDLRAVVELRYDPRQKTVVDLLEAYVRYRPVSTSRWRWTFKAGAFFPPISLENTGPGWTPEWTLTSSAVNSWVGQELRTIGGEASVEWRGDVDLFSVTAAAYGWNEPAGTAIQGYGWVLNDRAVGLFDNLRLPSQGGAPSYSYQFRQFDNVVGWYAGASWERPDIGRISLLRYDNGADPSAHDSYEYGWRTHFWSLAFSTELGPVTLLAQGLAGSTVVAPFAGFVSTTDFWAYYILAGVERGDWRFAARFDHFGTGEIAPSRPPRADEHGIAGTAAVTWSPRKWMSVTAETIVLDSWRAQRTLTRKSPRATEIQAQLALRVRF